MAGEASTSRSSQVTEGTSMTRPPYFNGEDYIYWKEKMKWFIQSTNSDLWDIIEDGPFTPVDDGGAAIPKARWTAEQKSKWQLNAKARYAIMCALSREEFEKVCACDSAKEMWDSLAIAHEGTNKVKETKVSMLVRKYELFKMEEGETIGQMYGRFQTITNGLKSLGKTYESEEHIQKILRSLPKQWRPLVTAISQAKDLKTMKLDELLGTLQIHEQELIEESSGKKSKSIALKVEKKPSKATSSKALKAEDTSDESEESESDESEGDDDELSLLTRKLKKMWKKRNFRKDKPFRRFNKHKEADSSDKSPIVCYECKRPGHMRHECPHLKEQPLKKPFYKKKKAMMATWDDLDSNESSDESDEEANICLMADTDDEPEVHSKFDELQDAYDELLEESNCLSKAFITLKKQYAKLVKEHEQKSLECAELSNENSKLKDENPKAEIIRETLSSEEEISNLQQKIEELTNDLASFVKGRDMLTMLLGSQRKSLGKSGLGFDGGTHHNVPGDSKNSFKVKQPFIKSYCTFCGKAGHVMSKCFRRQNRKSSQTPKTNHKGPKKIWVPKSQIIPVADLLHGKKKTPLLVLGQWLLTTHDGRRVYVPKPPT